MKTVTTLEQLLPLLDGVETCKQLAAVINANARRGFKRKLALAARDKLGRNWTDLSVLDMLTPSRHSPLRTKVQREEALLKTVTTLEELLPLVTDAKTCEEFGSIIIAHVPKRFKLRLALQARDSLGREWTDTVVTHWLAPAYHTEAHAQYRQAATVAYRANPVHQETMRKARVARRAIPEKAEQDKASSRICCTAWRRANRLKILLKNCESSSLKRGHSFTEVNQWHLEKIWQSAKSGNSPFSGLMDFDAWGALGGHPFAPSFDRLDCSKGYDVGNVVVVPNILNRTVNEYDRRLVMELIAKAARFNLTGQAEAPNIAALKTARPNGVCCHIYLAGQGRQVFKGHPALKPQQATLLKLTQVALYERGTCAVTGLAIIPTPGHPCFPSLDLVDHTKTGKRTYKGVGRAARRVKSEDGTETPEDMRLVCAFFNMGRCNFQDNDWWKMAHHVRALVDQGRMDELLRAPELA